MSYSRFFTLVALVVTTLTLPACEEAELEPNCVADAECTNDFRCVLGNCVPPPPALAIAEFGATPSTVAPGDTVSLAWKVVSASSGQISWGDQAYEIPVLDLANGTHDVVISESTTFTLTVQNSDGTSSDDVTVTVDYPSPEISEFSAAPMTIEYPNTTTLSWIVVGAESGLIVDDGGTVVHRLESGELETGTFDYAPPVTSTLTLEVTNEFALTATQDLELTVYGGAPEVTSFTGTPNPILDGQTCTLSWEVDDALDVTLEDENGDAIATELNPSDTFDVAPRDDTFYTLVSTNLRGTSRERLDVAVLEPIVITTFEADPVAITGGESTTLRWVIDGDVERIAIRGGGVSVATDGQPPSRGEVTVSPTADTEYTLTASSDADEKTESITVSVTPP